MFYKKILEKNNKKIYHFLFQGVIILDSNGESCDGDTSEAEDDRPREARVEASNNFVFVGAEIRTGKSTIRSKQSKRKVSISLGNKLMFNHCIACLACRRANYLSSVSSFDSQIATWPLHILKMWRMRFIQMLNCSSCCSKNFNFIWSISCGVKHNMGSLDHQIIDPVLLTLH